MSNKMTIVKVRADNWFIEDLSFPAQYPFSSERSPAGFAEYKSHGSITCMSDPAPIRCFRGSK